MNLIGILAAFVGPAAHAASNIFDAFVAGKVFRKVPTLVFYTNLTGLIAFPVLLLLGPINAVPPHLWMFIFLVALIDFAYLFPYYAALRLLDTSVVAALFSLGNALVPFLAYFIVGELLSPSQYIGFAVVLLSSVALNWNPQTRLRLNRGFWLMGLTAAILASEAVLYKKILLELDWISTAFWTALLIFVLRNTIFLVESCRQGIIASFPAYKKRFWQFLLIEVFDQLGSIAPVFALSVIPVLAKKSISSTQPVFVLIYGFVLYKLFGDKFKENLSRGEIVRKLACFAFISFGVYLVTRT